MNIIISALICKSNNTYFKKYILTVKKIFGESLYKENVRYIAVDIFLLLQQSVDEWTFADEFLPALIFIVFKVNPVEGAT